MDLAPEQHFVYAWRYTEDTVCKLGVSTLRSFYARIKAAKTVTYQDIELLGIEVFGTEAEARTAYQQRLKTFARVADRRAWVHFDAVVRQWLATECVSNPPTLDAFKDAFQNDPARREKEREYQRRSSQSRTPRKRKAAKPGKKRTEKDRAYEREYARKRRENDPAYKEKQMQRQKAWRTKNPGYDKNRYATDPAYAESRKAARRERYANDPEYRALEKQRRREFAQDNPDYREKRRVYIVSRTEEARRRGGVYAVSSRRSAVRRIKRKLDSGQGLGWEVGNSYSVSGQLQSQCRESGSTEDKVPSYKERIVLESGLQSPPTREFRRTEEGNLKLYLTFVRK